VPVSGGKSHRPTLTVSLLPDLSQPDSNENKPNRTPHIPTRTIIHRIHNTQHYERKADNNQRLTVRRGTRAPGVRQ
jgi:hypothetical protein